MTENPRPQRPGEWPGDRVDLAAAEQAIAEDQAEQEHGEQYMRLAQEHARHELVLDSIRFDLQQQPNAACLRAAERRWKNAITNLADELINTRRNER